MYNDYLILSKIYHSPKLREYYSQEYNSRINSAATFKLPFFTKDSEDQFFVMMTAYIYSLTISAYEKQLELKDLCTNLPPAAIEGHIKNYILVEELMKSNEIEGVRSSRKDIQTAVDGVDSISNWEKKKKIRFFNQVEQYFKLLNDEEIPLKTPQDIRNLYDEFLKGEIEDKDLPDGNIFRAGSVSVYSATGSELHIGIYPEKKIISAMDKLLGFLNDSSIPVLLKVAIAHYYFGYIHPFYDGNGRISRLISSVILAESFDMLVAMRLSFTIHENISKYYKAFEVSNDPLNKGDLTFFCTVFLEIICSAIDELSDDLSLKKTQLLEVSDTIKDLTDLNESEKSVLFILQQAKVFSNLSLGLKALEKNCDFGKTKIKKCLNSLEDKGYIYIDKSRRAFKYVLNIEMWNKCNQKDES